MLNPDGLDAGILCSTDVNPPVIANVNCLGTLYAQTIKAQQKRGWIQMHMPTDGSVGIHDVTETWGCLSLWGPNARQVLQAVSVSDVSNETFPYMTAQSVDLNGMDVWAQRVSYAGELGWELYISPEHAIKVWDALMEAGKEFGIQPAGYKALESLRIEKGYLYWSGDITPVDNPFEAGLGFCVNLDKGDFIGRDALVKIKEQGVRRKLCAITMDANCNLYGGESVYSHGRIIDRVRSGAYGYSIGKDIGLLYLPIELAKEGREFHVEIFGEHVPAQVAMTPLIDARGERLWP